MLLRESADRAVVCLHIRPEGCLHEEVTVDVLLQRPAAGPSVDCPMDKKDHHLAGLETFGPAIVPAESGVVRILEKRDQGLLLVGEFDIEVEHEAESQLCLQAV